MNEIKPPKFPLSRVTAEYAFFSAGICPICHSTIFKSHLLWGEKYCINDECENSKELIKFRPAIQKVRNNRLNPTAIWSYDGITYYIATDDIDRSYCAKLIFEFR